MSWNALAPGPLFKAPPIYGKGNANNISKYMLAVLKADSFYFMKSDEVISAAYPGLCELYGGWYLTLPHMVPIGL